MNYTIYHCHTENSLLDSVTNFESYYKFAKDNNMKSIAISEHGNAISWIKKKQFCNSLGLKYIHAVEIYLTESLEEKIRDNYHTILIAKNFDGVKEINKLISISTYKDHYYYKPRISFDEFLNTSSNIISISACMASPLNKLDKNNKYYNLLCKKYDYYEIQPHIVKEQIEYNKYLYELSLEYNKPLILGTDTHASSEYKSECRKIIKSAKHMEYDDEDKYDLSLKTYDELINMCKNQNCFNIDIYKEAINNTNIMADIISDFEFDKSFKYPKLYTNEEKEFKDFVNKKWKEKSHLFEDKKTYLDRIHEEFDLFKKQGMMSFMLFMGEMSEWCENNDIPRGYGRGSVTGSLIAYLFDITDVNPIIWNTNLARFCNPERISLGDIDVDYAPKDRDKVYKYIENRFGEFKTSRIMALGTISDMGTIQEIGRALNLTIPEVNDIKKLFEENQEEAKNKYPNVFKYYDGLIDSVVRTSFHPCGILASPITLNDNIGLLWNDKEEIWISQCDMKEVDSLNYVKFDILGLANIGIIKDVYKLIGSKYLKSHEINWNDRNVYDEMKISGVGIFQMESIFAHKSLCNINAQNIHDISMVNALIRPACESIRDKALKREFNKNPSEFIDNMLKDSYGYMIYQESILEFLQKVCGFSGGKADEIRRAIGKKQIEKLYELLPTIIEGYCRLSNKDRNIAEKEVEQYMKVIESAGSYGFSKNHSTPYSMIGYNCAYLRHYYPKEFLIAYMNNMENENDISNATNLARIKGIDIKNPKFGVFNTDYSIKDGVIYKGLRSIKYVSEDCINDLSKLDNFIYTTFYDLYKDMKEKCSINSRQIFALTIIDYFKDFGKTKKILDFIEYFDIIYKKKQIKKEKCNEFLTSIIKPIPSETNTQYKDFDYDKILYEIWNKLEDIEIDINEQIKYQLEYMGYISVEIPKNISIATVDVVSSKNAWVKLISARDNKEAWFCFEKKPKKHDIIKILPQDIEVKRSDYRRESKWVKKYEIIK